MFSSRVLRVVGWYVIRRLFSKSTVLILSSNASLDKSSLLMILSSPASPKLKINWLLSPNCLTRCSYSSVATKWRWLILVIAWRIESSMAPSVNSPPLKCAIGSFAIIAALTTESISNLSPKTTTISGLYWAYASAKYICAKPIDFDTLTKSVEDNSISIFCVILKSLSTSLYVSPCSLLKCIPVIKSCSSKELSFFISWSKGVSKP